MQVKMLICLSGVDFTVEAGGLHTCSAEEAERLVAAGYAEVVKPETVIETTKATGKKLTEKATKMLGSVEQRD